MRFAIFSLILLLSFTSPCYALQDLKGGIQSEITGLQGTNQKLLKNIGTKKQDWRNVQDSISDLEGKAAAAEKSGDHGTAQEYKDQISSKKQNEKEPLEKEIDELGKQVNSNNHQIQDAYKRLGDATKGGDAGSSLTPKSESPTTAQKLDELHQQAAKQGAEFTEARDSASKLNEQLARDPSTQETYGPAKEGAEAIANKAQEDLANTQKQIKQTQNQYANELANLNEEPPAKTSSGKPSGGETGKTGENDPSAAKVPTSSKGSAETAASSKAPEGSNNENSNYKWNSEQRRWDFTDAKTGEKFSTTNKDYNTSNDAQRWQNVSYIHPETQMAHPAAPVNGGSQYGFSGAKPGEYFSYNPATRGTLAAQTTPLTTTGSGGSPVTNPTGVPQTVSQRSGPTPSSGNATCGAQCMQQRLGYTPKSTTGNVSLFGKSMPFYPTNH